MKQQQPEQNTLKNLQIECLFLIKQLTEYLQKSIYRQAIQLVQNIFAKNSQNLHQVCAGVFLKILFLQTKAVNKLLEKNIYKKYIYEHHHTNKLIRILNRNNFFVKSILLTKIQSKQILDDRNSGLFVYDSTIVFNMFKNEIEAEDFQKLSKIFCEIYLSSVVWQIMNFKTYQLNLDRWQNFNELLHSIAINCPKFSFKIKFATISIKMIISRFLFEKDMTEQCLKLTNKVIQNLLDLHYNIRLWYEKIESNQNISHSKKLSKNRKKKHYLRKIMKMLLLALVVMIRANMKIGRENLAIEGIKIFNFVMEKTDPELSHFRRYLNPELTLFQQYFQYRSEKTQIQKIIQPLFLSQVKQLRNDQSSEIQTSIQRKQKNVMSEFYNDKMIEFQQRLNNKEKKQKIKRTANSHLLQSPNQNNNLIAQSLKATNKNAKDKIRQTKGLSSNPSQIFSQTNSNSNTRLSSSNVLNIDNFLVEDLAMANWAFLKQRQKGTKENGKFGASGLQGTNTQRQSNADNRNQSTEEQKVSEKENEHHLKLAKKLIGRILNTNSKLKLTSHFNTKQHVVRSSNITSEQKSKIPCDQKNKQVKIKQTGQKIMEMQKEIFKQLKSNVDLLKEKRDKKRDLLQVGNNMTDDPLRQQKRALMPKEIQMSSFIDKKYRQILLKSQQKASQSSLINKRDSKGPMDQRLTDIPNNNSFSNISHTYKDNLKLISKNSKLQMFIDLLVKNKEYLAVKKWSQKIEYLKKKDEMKEKVRAARKTTSINANSVAGLSPKMTFLAGNILKYSLQEIEEFGMNQAQLIQKMISYSHGIDNTNNFRLGQKSIQMLMNKLQKEKQIIIKKEKQAQRLKSAQTFRHDCTERSKQSGHATLRKSINGTGNTTKRSQWFCKFVL